MNLHAVSSPWSSGEPRDSLEADELMGRNFGEVQKEKTREADEIWKNRLKQNQKGKYLFNI